MVDGFYVHFNARLSIGISNKIDMQLKEFGKHYYIKELNIQPQKRNLVQRLWGLLPMVSNIWEYEDAAQIINDNHPKFIYIRRTVADRAQIKFLREIKRKNPNCKIIIEIYKYPYDKDEYMKWNAWPFFLKDVIYRARWKKYVDRIVTFSRDNAIFGIPTIKTKNGIDSEQIIRRSSYSRDNSIHMLAVAFLQHQHAYERVLYGMASYYANGGKRSICFHIVGDGPDLKKYQEIVETKNLQDHVIFYGKKTGKALEEIYLKCDIGVGALGLYKDNVYLSSALKIREYLAKGLPVITGCTEDVFEGKKFDYYLEFPNDSSEIDINKIILFYDKIFSGSTEQVSNEIYKFAVSSVGMDNSLGKVMEFINT